MSSPDLVVQTHKEFIHETFVSQGLAPWVQGAFKYTGYVLLLYGIVFLPFGFVLIFLADQPYSHFLLFLTIPSLAIAWGLGLGTKNEKRWAIYGWCGLTVAFCVGLIIVPYGYQLWFSALLTALLAIGGFTYRKSFVKGGVAGMIVSVLVVLSACVLVLTLARPGFMGGPTAQVREEVLTKFYSPGSFIRTDKGKSTLLILYGHTSSEIISGKITDEELLKEIYQAPDAFNSYSYARMHSIGGYVESIVLAIFNHATL